MIKSFGDSETEKIYDEKQSKKIPPDIQKRALTKLLLLNSAENELDLRCPPSNRFEHLSGKSKAYCSIRINDQWRILFKFISGDAYEVSIVDYH